MKTTNLLFIAFLCLSFSSFKASPISTSFKQDLIIVEGVYDGHEDYGYNFIVKGEDGNEHTFTFQKVDEALLTEFDLNGTTLVKAKFKITYITKIEVTKDADNFDQENEIDTIVKLEKL